MVATSISRPLYSVVGALAMSASASSPSGPSRGKYSIILHASLTWRLWAGGAIFSNCRMSVSWPLIDGLTLRIKGLEPGSVLSPSLSLSEVVDRRARGSCFLEMKVVVVVLDGLAMTEDARADASRNTSAAVNFIATMGLPLCPLAICYFSL